MNILLLEDDPEIAELAVHALRDMGHEVDHAINGKEGLKLVVTKGYSLIITDYQMPTMNGVEFTALTRKLNIDTPIHACTGMAHDSKVKENFYEAGAQGVHDKMSILKIVKMQKAAA